MGTQLNDITILVNDQQIAYESDSLSWKDGFGEYKIRNAPTGGGKSERIFSEDLGTKVGMVKFSLPSTPESEALKREWKIAKGGNVVELIGPPGSGFTKIFTEAAILDDPETSAATEGSIEIEFHSNQAQ